MQTRPQGATDTPDPAAREAVARIAREHMPRLWAIVLKLCDDPSQAEDLVQEVFVQALRSWHTFRGESQVTTWLYGIALNVARRMRRRRVGEPAHTASLDTTLPFDSPTIAQPADELDDILLQQVEKEARERLEQAICMLPDDFRLPLVLHEIAQLSVPEVSQILGIPEGTVKSRVHRARLRLREEVDRLLPRIEAAPSPYDQQVCLDLLRAKQEAIDRGVPMETEVLCDRCRSVFASLDLAHDLCRRLREDPPPDGLLERSLTRIRNA